jgi:replicative DNA helicase
MSEEAQTDAAGDAHRQRLQDGKDNLAAALDYLAWDLSVVLCCHGDHVGCGKDHAKTCTTPGKRPLYPWSDFQSKTRPTAEFIETQFKRFGIANVGIALGPVSQLVRVDVDSDAAEAALAKLSGGKLPVSWEFTSSPGSRGLLFRIPVGIAVPRTAVIRCEGGELRLQGEGAFTVLPPSRHAGGHRYAWVAGRGPDDIDCAVMPDWMIAAMPNDDRASATSEAPASELPPYQGPVPVEERVRRCLAYLEEVPGAVSGEGGHNHTFYVAFLIVRGFAVPLDEAMEVFQEWNEKCAPPWTEKELQHKLEDSLKRCTSLFGEKLISGTSPAAAPRPTGYVCDLIDSATFFALDCRPMWLVEGLLVADQPCILGGEKKVLKTTLGIDLAVSLGTGTPFLGHFTVPNPRRVAFISGESGKHTIQETGRRVCKARGIDPARCGVFWDFRLPQLASLGDLTELKRGLSERRAEVVLIDPLYLSLLKGNTEINPGSIYGMGPLLMDVAHACSVVGATPILMHHGKKGAKSPRDPYRPMELDDLSGAGVAEFARQWLLLSRREAFKPGSHRLWLGVGGSVGHGGLWGVDVEEGQPTGDFSGRTWLVAVNTAGEVIDRRAEDRRLVKKKEAAAEVDEACSQVMVALDKVADEDEAVGLTDLQASSGLGRDRFKRAVAALKANGTIEDARVPFRGGPKGGANGTKAGIRRRRMPVAQVG